jgi:hypothetical protein
VGEPRNFEIESRNEIIKRDFFFFFFLHSLFGCLENAGNEFENESFVLFFIVKPISCSGFQLKTKKVNNFLPTELNIWFKLCRVKVFDFSAHKNDKLMLKKYFPAFSQLPNKAKA